MDQSLSPHPGPLPKGEGIYCTRAMRAANASALLRERENCGAMIAEGNEEADEAVKAALINFSFDVQIPSKRSAARIRSTSSLISIPCSALSAGDAGKKIGCNSWRMPALICWR